MVSINGCILTIPRQRWPLSYTRILLGEVRRMPQATRFVIRTYHRIPVRCLLYYMGGEFLGKGTVVNMSRNGMRVLGDHQVVPGMELVLRLSLPDKDEPVEIQRVVVRWVRGLLFGAKIVTLAPDGEERVGELLKRQTALLTARRPNLVPSNRFSDV